MAKAMTRRNVERALKKQQCKPEGSGRGGHDKWRCPCGEHTAHIPRHGIVSPGVIRDTIDRMQCLPKGWLQ